MRCATTSPVAVPTNAKLAMPPVSSSTCAACGGGGFGAPVREICTSTEGRTQWHVHLLMFQAWSCSAAMTHFAKGHWLQCKLFAPLRSLQSSHSEVETSRRDHHVHIFIITEHQAPKNVLKPRRVWSRCRTLVTQENNLNDWTVDSWRHCNPLPDVEVHLDHSESASKELSQKFSCRCHHVARSVHFAMVLSRQ